MINKYLIVLIGFMLSPYAFCEDDGLCHYLISEDYFNRRIDINSDDILDIVVSSEKNTGDDLLFFERTDDGYHLVLKSVNLSEDGGRIIDDIVASVNGDNAIVITTYYPKENNRASHNIVRDGDDWILRNTVYEFTVWQDDPDKIYSCDVMQNIKMTDLLSDDGKGRVRSPPETHLDQFCEVSYVR